MAGKVKSFSLEDAQIMFRNFAGKEGPYNKKGDRNFALILPVALAQELLENGWNVRVREPKEADGEILTETVYYLPVKVSYDNRPPRVVLIASGRHTPLDEESIECLDYADILSVDVAINPYEWQNSVGSGIKAYVKTLFVTIDEDPIERKYALLAQKSAYGE